MRRLTLLLVAAAALVALVTSENAAAAGTTQIAGIQGPDTACGDVNNGIFGMAGSLVGCWYTTAITYDKANPSGTIQVRGTETFVGCLNGTTCGSFNTTFTFTAKYAPDPGRDSRPLSPPDRGRKRNRRLHGCDRGAHLQG